MSMPMGSSASNIDAQDTRSQIAPNLPSPQLGPNASPVDYLRAAQSALAAGQTGEAQQALEEAQTRLLDRSVAYGQTNNPSDNPAVAADHPGAACSGGRRSGAVHAVDPVGDPGGAGDGAVTPAIRRPLLKQKSLPRSVNVPHHRGHGLGSAGVPQLLGSVAAEPP